MVCTYVGRDTFAEISCFSLNCDTSFDIVSPFTVMSCYGADVDVNILEEFLNQQWHVFCFCMRGCVQKGDVQQRNERLVFVNSSKGWIYCVFNGISY